MGCSSIIFLGGEVGATTSSNATIPVADPREGPAPLPPYSYSPPPPKQGVTEENTEETVRSLLYTYNFKQNKMEKRPTLASS